MSWAYWEGRDFILPRPWLGGHFLETAFPPLSWDSPSSVVARETLAGTHKAWVAFSEPKAPRGMSGVSISIDAYDVSEEDYRVMESLSQAGKVTTYADGRPVTDRFPNATSGQSLKLTRSKALGIVTGITEEFFPTIVRLDGAINAGAASITGQTVTVNTTGDLEVVYTPIYSVLVLGSGWSIGQFNDIRFAGRRSFVLQEVILEDFS